MMKDHRMSFIGHGYSSMPHSFKHGYGNPYRRRRIERTRRAGFWLPYR
ncbi:hypothetical protein HOO54_14745 [Bacillus sp. WMMC1349]|nr:hypothetical protein [Bacillus sp. WMMC1349]NPC93458.1 hypothetical protein [Bacillus sp. WMMC1349]